MRIFPLDPVVLWMTEVTQQLENQYPPRLTQTGLRFEASPRGTAQNSVTKLFKVLHLMFPLIVSCRIRVHNVKPNEVC